MANSKATRFPTTEAVGKLVYWFERYLKLLSFMDYPAIEMQRLSDAQRPQAFQKYRKAFRDAFGGGTIDAKQLGQMAGWGSRAPKYFESAATSVEREILDDGTIDDDS